MLLLVYIKFNFVNALLSLFVIQFNIFYETLYEIQFEKSNTFHICNAIS